MGVSPTGAKSFITGIPCIVTGHGAHETDRHLRRAAGRRRGSARDPQRWVHRHRDHGGVRFVDVRDRYGLTQVVGGRRRARGVALPRAGTSSSSTASPSRGTFRAPAARHGEPPHAHRRGGGARLGDRGPQPVRDAAVHGRQRADAKEDDRLRWRYLDLPDLLHAAEDRAAPARPPGPRGSTSWAGASTRIETPLFIRSTPEGARDFLVPSR